MTARELELAELTAEEWRSVAGPCVSPAGSLYASGIFAEPDIMEAEASYTVSCSACTASSYTTGIQCC